MLLCFCAGGGYMPRKWGSDMFRWPGREFSTLGLWCSCLFPVVRCSRPGPCSVGLLYHRLWLLVTWLTFLLPQLLCKWSSGQQPMFMSGCVCVCAVACSSPTLVLWQLSEWTQGKVRKQRSKDRIPPLTHTHVWVYVRTCVTTTRQVEVSAMWPRFSCSNRYISDPAMGRGYGCIHEHLEQGPTFNGKTFILETSAVRESYCQPVVPSWWHEGPLCSEHTWTKQLAGKWGKLNTKRNYVFSLKCDSLAQSCWGNHLKDNSCIKLGHFLMVD